MKIVFFTKYTQRGASSRYRTFQYLEYYRQYGFNVDVYSLFPTKYIDIFYNTGKKPISILIPYYFKRIFQCLFIKADIVVIEYELFPYLPWFLEKLFLRRKKIILDYDDAVFHYYDEHPNSLIRKLLSNKIPERAKKSNCIIAGSPYLYAFLKKFNKATIEIPTSIQFEKYINTGIVRKKKDIKPFVVGWIGSKDTSKNLLLLKPALLQIQKKYNVILRVIGFDKNSLHILDGLNYEILPWSADTEIAEISKFHVGVMPLIDSSFNKGKCGFKLIQYMACAIPTISTPTDTNKKINEHSYNLFANTDEEWFNAIETILLNTNKYALVGQKNQQVIQLHYSIEANHKKYINIFNQLTS